MGNSGEIYRSFLNLMFWMLMNDTSIGILRKFSFHLQQHLNLQIDTVEIYNEENCERKSIYFKEVFEINIIIILVN
jgi:hypothetical protein